MAGCQSGLDSGTLTLPLPAHRSGAAGDDSPSHCCKQDAHVLGPAEQADGTGCDGRSARTVYRSLREIGPVNWRAPGLTRQGWWARGDLSDDAPHRRLMRTLFLHAHRHTPQRQRTSFVLETLTIGLETRLETRRGCA
jgi:hypothetical protein